MRWLWLLGWLLPAIASADEVVLFCYNWSCIEEARVVFSEPLLRSLTRSLAGAANAADERQRLVKVVGRMYAEAARQSPIAADRAGNSKDAESNGRMDCIDHSTTTTRLLKLLERRGALIWHRVLPPVRRRRFILVQHFSAVIEEVRPRSVLDTDVSAEAARYVVDSWFVDPGEPALLLPLERWMDGEGPDVDN